jgi:ribosomal protein S1
MAQIPEHIFKGAIVTGTVDAVLSEGAYVDLGDGFAGLLQDADAARDLRVGQKIEVLVTAHPDPHAGIALVAVERGE